MSGLRTGPYGFKSYEFTNLRTFDFFTSIDENGPNLEFLYYFYFNFDNFLKVYNYFIPGFMKFYFQSYKEKSSQIGLLFRNFAKYVSLTVGKKMGLYSRKKQICKISAAGDFRAEMPLPIYELRVHTQRNFVQKS